MKRDKAMNPLVERLMNELGIGYSSAWRRLQLLERKDYSIDEYIAAGGVPPRIAKGRIEIDEIMKRLGMSRKKAIEWRNYCRVHNKDFFTTKVPSPRAP